MNLGGVLLSSGILLATSKHEQAARQETLAEDDPRGCFKAPFVMPDWFIHGRSPATGNTGSLRLRAGMRLYLGVSVIGFGDPFPAEPNHHSYFYTGHAGYYPSMISQIDMRFVGSRVLLSSSTSFYFDLISTGLSSC